jgi:hypothetical protein
MAGPPWLARTGNEIPGYALWTGHFERYAMPSTAIRRLFYDSAKSELWVTFVTGRRYVYADVPLEVFEAFETAESRGAFFNDEIRDCYPYQEVRRRSDAERQ